MAATHCHCHTLTLAGGSVHDVLLAGGYVTYFPELVSHSDLTAETSAVAQSDNETTTIETVAVKLDALESLILSVRWIFKPRLKTEFSFDARNHSVGHIGPMQ